MKSLSEAEIAYPHVVRPGGRDSLRYAVEDSGDRSALLAAHVARAVATRSGLCVVWAANDCSWIKADGTVIGGTSPPTGTPVETTELNVAPLTLEEGRAIELSGTALPSHLFVRRVAPGYVEISAAGPIHLAHLDEPPLAGAADPAEGLIGDDGGLVAPETWRGQPVTGILNGWTLLGPIQPSGPGTVLRKPWPDEVDRICERIARRPLSNEALSAVWAACVE